MGSVGRVFSWTFLFVVLIMFGAGAIAVHTIFFGSSPTAVPMLRDMPVTDAVAEAERLGLAVKIEYADSTLPDGRVLAQSPEPGAKIRDAQIIVLQVSGGGKGTPVPDLRGQQISRAQDIIKERGFMLGDVVRIRDESQPPGAVISQNPSHPSEVPLPHRIDLLVNEGGSSPAMTAVSFPGTAAAVGSGGGITVPDVNRMTEQEARAALDSAGIKIQSIDRVFSPVVPDGTAIETRPGAGAQIQPGEGVRLKIATSSRPAGYIEATSTPEGRDQRRATIPGMPGGAKAEPQQTPSRQEAPKQGGQSIVVSVPGQGDVFIGDGTPQTGAPIREADPNISVFDQRNVKPAQTQPQAQSQPRQASAPQQAPAQGGKVARIRYQVPPLSSPLNIRIELTDPSGRRDVLNRQAKSAESVYVEAPYTRECVVSIYLGGDFVWQEKYR